MKPVVSQANERLRRIQILFGIAVFFHGVADPVITYIIITFFGSVSEANPFIRWGLEGGLTRFVLIHIPLFVLAGACLWALTKLLKRASGWEEKITYQLTEIGMYVLIAWGIWLVIKNLWVFYITQ